MHVYNNQLSPGEWAGSGITSMDLKSTGTGVSVNAYLCMRRMQLPSGGALRTAVPPTSDIPWCHGVNKTISSFNGYQCFHMFFFLHVFLQPLPAPLCPSVLPGAAQILQSSHFRLSLVAFCIYRADEADYTFQALTTPLYWTEKNLLTKTLRILSFHFPPSSSSLWGYPNHHHRC